MLRQIASLTDLDKNSINIQTYLEITISDDPNEISDRGNNLSVYLARTSKMLADAKYHLDIAKKKSILMHTQKALSPSTLKDLVNADTEYENYLVNLIERQNRTCVHQMDWCRTMISKLKEEMKYIS